jgi:hypothetical protein
MNREDIIRMARVAGCRDNGEEFRFVKFRYLERFANLIASAEREACAKVCDRFQERDVGMQPAECAGAIRARGQS